MYYALIFFKQNLIYKNTHIHAYIQQQHNPHPNQSTKTNQLEESQEEEKILSLYQLLHNTYTIWCIQKKL